jgi:hypothetical protein
MCCTGRLVSSVPWCVTSMRAEVPLYCRPSVHGQVCLRGVGNAVGHVPPLRILSFRDCSITL